MNLIKPETLKIGDTIGIAALSGAIDEAENIHCAKVFFENRGYKVVLSENIFEKYRYLADDDATRATVLNDFFLNPDIKAIICARGGYGTLRILDKINYEAITQNPKIFCGYSDATAISAMIYKKTGLVTYSGPMAYGDFGIEKPSQFTIDNFFNAVCSNSDLTFKSDGKIYNSGNAEGILWGGNLATLVSLCGRDFIPDEKFIFFTEDLNEPVYKIDKMLTQLISLPEFRKNVAGIALGDFLDVDNQKWLEELFSEISEELKIPVVSGFKITHAKDKITLPIGKKCLLKDNSLVVCT